MTQTILIIILYIVQLAICLGVITHREKKNHRLLEEIRDSYDELNKKYTDAVADVTEAKDRVQDLVTFIEDKFKKQNGKAL